jgi:hypothetical protein
MNLWKDMEATIRWGMLYGMIEDNYDYISPDHQKELLSGLNKELLRKFAINDRKNAITSLFNFMDKFPGFTERLAEIGTNNIFRLMACVKTVYSGRPAMAKYIQLKNIGRLSEDDKKIVEELMADE